MEVQPKASIESAASRSDTMGVRLIPLLRVFPLLSSTAECMLALTELYIMLQLLDDDIPNFVSQSF